MKIIATPPHYEFDSDLEIGYYLIRENDYLSFYRGEVFKTFDNTYYQVFNIYTNTEPDGQDFEIFCIKFNFLQKWMYKFFRKCAII